MFLSCRPSHHRPIILAAASRAINSSRDVSTAGPASGPGIVVRFQVGQGLVAHRFRGSDVGCTDVGNFLNRRIEHDREWGKRAEMEKSNQTNRLGKIEKKMDGHWVVTLTILVLGKFDGVIWSEPSAVDRPLLSVRRMCGRKRIRHSSSPFLRMLPRLRQNNNCLPFYLSTRHLWRMVVQHWLHAQVRSRGRCGRLHRRNASEGMLNRQEWEAQWTR